MAQDSAAIDHIRLVCQRWFVVLAMFLAWTSAAPASAYAQEDGLAVTGSVTGALRAGGRATFRLEASVPGGWRNLRELKVTMVLHGLVLAETTYFERLDAIAVRGSPLVRAGTEQVLDGSFFRVDGSQVRTQKGGNQFVLVYVAMVRQEVPEGTEFRLTAVANDGAVASVVWRIQAARESNGGYDWGTLGLTVIVALFAGAFLGNLFTSRRQAKRRVSVYELIRSRLEEERARAGA